MYTITKSANTRYCVKCVYMVNTATISCVFVLDKTVSGYYHTIYTHKKLEERKMKIAGLQKLTLLDYPGKVACTVFCPACNFRCPFCHNSPLVLLPGGADEIPVEDVLAYLNKRKGILEGVAITGGEPLLQADIVDFIREVKKMGFSVKLDTNGSMPDKLELLISAELVDMVAMDIKNAPELYAVTAGIENPDLAAVTRSKDLLLENRVDYEFRTTVVRGLHTEQSLVSAAEWIRGARTYWLQGYRVNENIINPEGLTEFSPEELKAFAAKVAEIIPNTGVRGV